jgi:hypothetical protein
MQCVDRKKNRSLRMKPPVQSADFDLPDDFDPPKKTPKLTAEQYEEQRRLEESRRFDEQPLPQPKTARETAKLQSGPIVRTLPASIEAEEYLLSCCFLDGRDVVGRCIEAHIGPEDFYDGKNGLIYERLLDCHQRNVEIDISVVAEELKANRLLDQVGGYSFLTQISTRIPTTAQAGYFIDKVREQSLLRKLIRSCTGAVEECYSFSGGIDEFAADIQNKIAKVVNGANGVARPVPLISYEYPTQRDPNVLLGDDDYLGRGGGMVLISYAGAGKSSLVMQMGLNWGIGRPAFGLRSNGPLKVLMIQGEDSARYLGKVAASYAASARLKAEERKLLERNVLIQEVKGVAGAAFLSRIERLIDKYEPDIVVINPVYLYVEGDISNSADVKPFLLGLDQIQISAKKKFGWLLVHHTGKPTGKDAKGQRAELDNWETMYMGIGSSFWANWPRASAMLEPRASKADGRHYWLKFGKGWQNAGIVREREENGEKKIERINRIALRYSDETIEVAGEKRPLISWEHDAEGEKEFADKQQTARENGKRGGGRPTKWSFQMVRPALQRLAGTPEKAQGFNVLYRTANDVVAISKPGFNRVLQDAIQHDEIRQVASGALTGRYWVPDAPAPVQKAQEGDLENLHWPDAEA